MSSDQSSSLSSIHSDTARQGCKIWGGELSASRKTCKFESEEDNMIHLLSLWTICLGGTTKEEMHVIAVEGEQTQGKQIVIASLQPSLQPMWGGKLEDVMGICQVNVHDIEITPPVTFILMSGSGPVYISGQDILVDDQLDNLAPEEDPSFENAILKCKNLIFMRS
ncbi:nucleophosmin-like isoform X1 [Rana temporaria]|uniref:nucleophosmin-like isoform X1 n=1 Tax=Rana temporaria TaxID=8407 RepID=UPI001AADE466|nr:nucleophosmin-like isoform X1 [Rana temporaria]